MPFTFTTKSLLNFSFESRPYWLKPNDTELIINLNDTKNPNGNWIVGNLKHAGFYRVNYDVENWNSLVSQLNMNGHELIDVTMRSQLIDDSYNLGRAEYVDQTVFLRVVNYLRNESDSKPFLVSLKGLNYINGMLALSANETIKKLFGIFFQGLFIKSYTRLNWKNITDDISEM